MWKGCFNCNIAAGKCHVCRMEGNMSLTLALVMLGLSAAVGAFSAFVVSYMQEKGKNLATKEDVQNVVSQMSAITAATKKIEAEISDKVWDRQKRWELRRDVAFEAAKATGVAKDALTKMHAVYMTEKQAAAQGKPE